MSYRAEGQAGRRTPIGYLVCDLDSEPLELVSSAREAPYLERHLRAWRACRPL